MCLNGVEWKARRLNVFKWSRVEGKEVKWSRVEGKEVKWSRVKGKEKRKEGRKGSEKPAFSLWLQLITVKVNDKRQYTNINQRNCTNAQLHNIFV